MAPGVEACQTAASLECLIRYVSGEACRHMQTPHACLRSVREAARPHARIMSLSPVVRFRSFVNGWLMVEVRDTLLIYVIRSNPLTQSLQCAEEDVSINYMKSKRSVIMANPWPPNSYYLLPWFHDEWGELYVSLIWVSIWNHYLSVGEIAKYIVVCTNATATLEQNKLTWCQVLTAWIYSRIPQPWERPRPLTTFGAQLTNGLLVGNAKQFHLDDLLNVRVCLWFATERTSTLMKWQ